MKIKNILQKELGKENFEKIVDAGKIMVSSLQSNGKIISCGNGGSMCDAMHFAEELTGRYRNDRPSIAIRIRRNRRLDSHIQWRRMGRPGHPFRHLRCHRPDR